MIRIYCLKKKSIFNNKKKDRKQIALEVSLLRPATATLQAWSGSWVPLNIDCSLAASLMSSRSQERWVMSYKSQECCVFQTAQFQDNLLDRNQMFFSFLLPSQLTQMPSFFFSLGVWPPKLCCQMNLLTPPFVMDRLTRASSPLESKESEAIARTQRISVTWEFSWCLPDLRAGIPLRCGLVQRCLPSMSGPRGHLPTQNQNLNQMNQKLWLVRPLSSGASALSWQLLVVVGCGGRQSQFSLRVCPLPNVSRIASHPILIATLAVSQGQSHIVQI